MNSVIRRSFLPNLYFDSKIIINSRPLGCTCSWRCNGLELCNALAEFLVSSLFRAFLFLAILATFTLQMFFSFDSLSFFITLMIR